MSNLEVRFYNTLGYLLVALVFCLLAFGISRFLNREWYKKHKFTYYTVTLIGRSGCAVSIREQLLPNIVLLVRFCTLPLLNEKMQLWGLVSVNVTLMMGVREVMNAPLAGVGEAKSMAAGVTLSKVTNRRLVVLLLPAESLMKTV